MTLIGFKPRNHPQQVRRLGADDTIDTRVTPHRMWLQWHREFAFTLDAAANSKNAKCAKFYDLAADGLKQPWTGERVWCNPPFSNLPAWVSKAREEFAARCPLIVMLLPANRTEQRWWQDLIEPFRMGVATSRLPVSVEVRFLPGRPRFGWPPGRVVPKKGDRPPFGLCVVIWRRGHR